MPGTSFPRRFAALTRRRKRLDLVLLVALLLPGYAACPQSVEPAPGTPTAPATIPGEPSLPTDPTSPSTVGTPATPGISLIPASPLLPPEPPPRRPADTLSGGSPPDPFAVPREPNAIPADATVLPASNDIGAARRFQYNFGLTIGTTFDDNIFLDSADRRSDLYFTFQPTLSLGLGGGKSAGDDATVVRFNYSPEVLLYVDHPELDAVQHFIALSASHRFNRLSLSAAQNVQILDSTDVGNPQSFSQTSPTTSAPNSNVNLDTGQRTRANLYATSVQANYSYSDKVSYDLNGSFGVNDYAGKLLSSRTVSAGGTFNYTPTGKTTFGLGASAGYTLTDGITPDQLFEQLNFNLSYSPGFKLNASVQVGLELRQAGGGFNELTPVFELNLGYSPFDGTTINLTGSRRVFTSAVEAGQNYTATTLTLSLNQRFYQRYYLHVDVGYTNTTYVAVAQGVDGGRTDNYFFVQPGLDFKVHENILVGAFFSYRDSTSTGNGRPFVDNQVGLRLSIFY